ncbi:MAG: hypoxanthine phosphoribosyltransferase [Bacteroidota bacterium]
MGDIQIHDKSFEPYLTAESIQQRVAALGKTLSHDYEGRSPIVLCILNGSFIFTADLVRAMHLPVRIEFVRYSSYSGTSSTGQITQIMGLKSDLKDEHVIIVEDIIDTGFTIASALRDLQKSNPASVKVVSLLLKPDALRHEVPTDYIGFEIPNDFVVGYGLDYDELGRDLPAIYRLKG